MQLEQNSNGQPVEGNILLESGTNELEVLVFAVGDSVFGVNVAKVREVILPREYAVSPEQPDCVLGMFNLRGGVLSLVDLHKYLDITPCNANPKQHRIIVTEFNGQRAAFRVERVEHIHRMSWENVDAVPDTGGDHHFAITGITKINDQLVLMLDFESILDEIAMQDQLHVECVENTLGVDRENHRIFLAEDSKFIRNIMVNLLTNSGYTKVESFGHGRACWNRLMKAVETGDTPSVIVTDIEMPMMDGLALTRNIKSHPQLKHIPVVLFSSLITDDTRHKGQQVGADDQIHKPQLKQLVELADGWIANGSEKQAA